MSEIANIERGEIHDLKPFRYWCQKVLPLVYEDSLSYYELLSKVVDYLNKTMEDITTMNEDITKLYEYTNHYFDNLDVTEEINNKLDEMASDGTLSTIVSPYVGNAVTKWLDDNITQETGYVIDKSLSVLNAAGDAYKTGIAFEQSADPEKTENVNIILGYSDETHTIVESPIIPVSPFFVLFNEKRTINGTTVFTKIDELNQDKTKIAGTSESESADANGYQYGLARYIGHNQNTKYIKVSVHISGYKSISASVLNTINDSLSLHNINNILSGLQIDNDVIYGYTLPDANTIVHSEGEALRWMSKSIYKVSDFKYIQPLFTSKYRYSFYYYDNNFEYLGSGTWHVNYLDAFDNNDAVYYSIGYAEITENTYSPQAITTELKTYGGTIVNPIMRYGMPSSKTGEYNYYFTPRASSNLLTINDGGIIILNREYDYYFSVFDLNNNFLYQSPYYGFTEDNQMANFIHFKNCKIIITVAHRTHTDNITPGQLGDLNKSFVCSIIELSENNRMLLDNFYNYPNYYESDMAHILNTVPNYTGQDAVCFGFITDLHDNGVSVDEYNMSQIASLKKINESCKIDFMCCGGDLSDGNFKTKTDAYNKFTELVNRFSKIGCDIFMLHGNHDDNSYGGVFTTSVMVNKTQYYQRAIAPLIRNIHTGYSATYYYKDYNNFRVIALDYMDYPETIKDGAYVYHGLNANWRGYSDQQISWLANTLLTNEKPHVVILSHYSTNSKLTSTEEGHNVTIHNRENVNSLLYAFNNRTSVTINGNTYDFSNVESGHVDIQVTGHAHSYGAFVENGICWVSVGSSSPEVTKRVHDSTQYEDMETRTYFTPSEPHFVIITIVSNKIYINTFGAMDDIALTL